MKVNKRARDFKAFKLKIKEDAKSPHIIYVKEHTVREHSADKPSGRTLFVINIPPYIDESGIRAAFSEVGNIESIKFLETPNEVEIDTTKKFIQAVDKPTFKVAFVVFEKVSDLNNVLKLKRLKPINSESNILKCGMSKWIEEYNNSVLLAKALKERIDKFMKQHDEETSLAQEKEKRLEQEDDEGWVTVTKKGKVQSFPRTEKVENKIMAKEELGKKRKELKNFYTFQIRESKMKHIVSLRQKFEEDKKRIAQIKQSRRFKPF